MIDRIAGLLKENRHEEALEALEQQSPDSDSADRLFLRCVTLVRMNRLSEVKMLVRSALSRFAGDERFALLSRELDGSPQVAPQPAPPAVSAVPAPDFYGPAIANPSSLASLAMSEENWDEILRFHGALATDDYVRYVDSFYRRCRAMFGRHWKYCDITNVLYAAARALRPSTYLEIGVRTGRSACVVARACPEVDIYAFDMWVSGYAGLENPGPDYVRKRLGEHGHRGRVEFIDGNSHETLPQFFGTHSGFTAQLVTVDGDHSEEGAFRDLCDVIPHLAVGGVIVFDDIVHPEHKYLLKVWRNALAQCGVTSSFEYGEVGYGVAFAIKTR